MFGAIITIWRTMTWDVALVAVLLGVSVLSLAVSGADLPYRIQTFARSSPEEHAFFHRAIWLRVIGFTALGMATLVGALRMLW
jgi:hypothetical protein